MPQYNEVHVDKLLSNVSFAYHNEGFVGESLFPIVKVQKDSDKYTLYGKERFRRNATKVADKTPTKKIDWTVTFPSYECEDYGLHDLISDKEKRNADKPLNLRIDTTEVVTDMLALDREARVLEIVFSTSIITNNTTLTGTDQWSNSVDSDPIGNIVTGRSTIKKAIGKKPNTLCVTEDVWDVLREHPQLLERIKYSMKGILTEDLVAQILGLERVIVAGGLEEQSTEGQSSSLDYLQTKKALLCFVEKNAGLKKITLGKTFMSQKPVVRSWRENKLRSEVIEVIETTDEKLVAAGAGYLIDAAIV